jgi:hypothetical protein
MVDRTQKYRPVLFFAGDDENTQRSAADPLRRDTFTGINDNFDSMPSQLKTSFARNTNNPLHLARVAK